MDKKVKVIAFDFDKTLAYITEDEGYDSPIKDLDIIPKSKEMICGWIEQGIEVFIFTCRPEGQFKQIRKWLDDNDLQDIKRIVHKEHADYCYDDKAVEMIPNEGKTCYSNPVPASDYEGTLGSIASNY